MGPAIHSLKFDDGDLKGKVNSQKKKEKSNYGGSVVYRFPFLNEMRGRAEVISVAS